MGLRGLERGGTVVGDVDFMPPGLQEPGQAPCRVRLVVHDEHAFGAGLPLGIRELSPPLLPFAAEHLTVGVVAHEMIHAANGYLACGRKRAGAYLSMEREEELALLVQGLCQRFCAKWHRYGEPKAKRWREKDQRRKAA